MYESLLEWDPKLNIRPAIASDYQVVNSKRIIWTIRPGIKFSNGQPVTAADVVYSFNLQLNPPLPGSTAVLGQVPAIAGVTAIGTNKVQMDLTKPDARVYGYLAWQRYSAIVPNNMYTTLNAATQGIGTGPFMLSGSYVPNDHVNYVKNPNYWKPGLPYMDGVNYKIVTDEQTRIAGVLAGQLDGATISQPNAANLIGNPKVTVLHNLTAAFRELQFTIKPGENKPWADKRVRQAVNFAINRANILTKVYGGFGQNSGHVAAGYGPWPLTRGPAADEVPEVRPADGEVADEGGRLERLQRDDDDVRDADRLRGDRGAHRERPLADRDQRQHRHAGLGDVRGRKRRRARSTGISPRAACAATSTATWPSTTRRRPPTRPGSRATAGTRRCSG